MSGSGGSESSTDLLSAFGRLPQRVAKGLWGQQLGPQLRYLGMGAPEGSKRYLRQQERLDSATGPMADIFRYLRGGIVPESIGGAEAVGAEMATRGRDAFDVYSGEVDRALSSLPFFQEQIEGALAQLPAFQEYASQGAGLAAGAAERAFSPIADEDMFRVARDRGLESVRAGTAARGMEMSGEGQQGETDFIRDLVMGLRDRRFGEQQQALRGLDESILAGTSVAGATGPLAMAGADISTAGVPIAGSMFEAVNSLGQALMSEFNMPLEQAQQLMGLLTGGQTNAMGLLQQILPTTGSSSKGLQFCCAADTPIRTPRGTRPISRLRVGDVVQSRDAAGRPVRGHVIATVRRPIRPGHLFLQLQDGTRISPNHPLPDGTPMYARVDGAMVWAGRARFTYDVQIDTGVYFVGDVALGSTLDTFPQRRAA
jgi:hypothetical protein